MEEAKGSSSSSTTSSRWNPTKEQIAMLEGLFRQGVRTPSAEEIQQITGKLKEYGSIEGKNVFYWFQNHKARQRQREKQESFAYFSRFLHHAPPPPPIVAPPFPSLTTLPPSACTNVVCSPYCLPVSPVGNVGFCKPKYPNGFSPGAIKRKPMKRTERRRGTSPERYINSAGNHHDGTGHAVANGTTIANGSITHQTLELFPLHPTGILDDKTGSSLTTASGETESLDEGEEGEGGDCLAFPNFFVAP